MMELTNMEAQGDELLAANIPRSSRVDRDIEQGHSYAPRLQSERVPFSCKSWCRNNWIAVALVSILLAILLGIIISKAPSPSAPTSSPSNTLPDSNAIASCINQHRMKPLKTSSNGLYQGNLLIQHAEIWDGIGHIITDADILIINGKINEISAANTRLSTPSPSVKVVDVKGRIVTPGLVDLHNHAGVDGWPSGMFGPDDTNEMTNPTTPQIRAVDAFNPSDTALPLILSGGVTTAQVMPGSSNAMGGEGILLKLKIVGDGVKTVDDMIIANHTRLLKFACGENVKRTYGSERKQTPGSRMGAAWVMREKFEKAQKQLWKQENWCASPSSIQSSTPFPSDLSVAPLVSLLQNDVRLNVHCYMVHDMEMMIRMSHEFNFSISAFHHSLEAYRIPQLLHENNIAVATFSDLWGYKYEAYNASTLAPIILYQNNVSVILKTDHPVTFAGDLMFEAAKAHYYGLPAQVALAAVTSNPARAAGLGDRVGSIQKGLDGDIVVWDRDPLTVAARPHFVFIEGVQVVDNNIPMSQQGPSSSSSDVLPGIKFVDGPTNPCTSSTPVSLSCYAITGVSIYTLLDTDPLQPVTSATIVVQDGIITCVGPSCTVPSSTSCSTFTQTQGIIIPGLIESSSHLGLLEIEAESTSMDGYPSDSGLDVSRVLRRAIDGVRINTKHTQAAWKAGVTSAITSPQGSALISGLSVAFHTCCGNVVDQVLVNESVSLKLNLDNNAKNGDITSSISGQISALRSLFRQALSQPVNSTAIYDPLYPFLQALRGELSVSISADELSVIAAILRLQKEFGFELIINGGAEAHLIASMIASAKPSVSVILNARQQPDSYATKNAVRDAASRLMSAGVRVGVAVGDPGLVRNLRWEAGIAGDKHNGDLSELNTLKLVTSNIADMYHLPNLGRIKVNQTADFVVFNGSPFSTQSSPQLVASGLSVQCQPKQI